MKTLALTIVLLMSLASPRAFTGEGKGKGKGPGAKQEEPTKEQRQKMAENMEKFAACLRTDKSMKDCHEQCEKDCEASGTSCPMHGMKGMHGHHHGHDDGDEGAKKE